MKVFFTALCCSFSLSLFSQDTKDSLAVSDTVKTHSVKLATIFSTALPGAGQVYNHMAMPKGKKKAFWKVPLIYAGLGATTYFALKNNSEQRAIKSEYTFRVDPINNGAINDPTYFSYDNQGLLTLYNQKVNRRDLFFIGVGLVYLIQIADAAVEAHFVDFDVSDDLSFSIRPAFLPSNHFGMALSFNFR